MMCGEQWLSLFTCRFLETANSKYGDLGVWFDKIMTFFVHDKLFQSLTGIKSVKNVWKLHFCSEIYRANIC